MQSVLLKFGETMCYIFKQGQACFTDGYNRHVTIYKDMFYAMEDVPLPCQSCQLCK